MRATNIILHTVVLYAIYHYSYGCMNNYQSINPGNEWKQEQTYRSNLVIKPKQSMIKWELRLEFSQPLAKDMVAYETSVPSQTKGKKIIKVTSKSWNKRINAGDRISFMVNFNTKTNGNYLKCVEFCGQLVGSNQNTCSIGRKHTRHKHHSTRRYTTRNRWTTRRHTTRNRWTTRRYTTRNRRTRRTTRRYTTKQPRTTTTTSQPTTCLNNYRYRHKAQWQHNGNWRTSAVIKPFFYGSMRDWELRMEFKQPLTEDMTVWNLQGARGTKGKQKVVLKPEGYNMVIKSRGTKFAYFVDFKNKESPLHLRCAEFCGTMVETNKKVCSEAKIVTTTTTAPTTTTTTTTTTPTTTTTTTPTTTTTTTTTTPTTTTTTTPTTTTTATPTTTTTTTTPTTTTTTTTPTTTTTATPTTTTTTTTPTTTTTTTTPTTTPSGPCAPKYNYGEVLEKSLLFYEAQRSGKLPADQRVKWRKDSTLNDGANAGLDLTGGYFDAGDYVKFGFPMAATITNLAWGMLEFKKGYQAAGQFEYGMKTIKWGTDYFLKCHSSSENFIGQVGDGDIDHDSWGRPEDLNTPRPVYQIDQANPGSELAAETAAALAASYMLFRDLGDLSYALDCLTNAKQLYLFAMKHRGEYHKSITDAKGFYESFNGYNDELAWASLWLYRATGEEVYKNNYLGEFDGEASIKDSGEFSWDDKWYGVQVLAQQMKITDKNYLGNFKSFLQQPKKTPKGLFFVRQYGANRHAANLAFLARIASTITDSNDKNFYNDFARSQIHYMLGDSGRSYVVGFGNNPPQRPHHRSSSCPDSGECGWENFRSPEPNPHILYGALVGGPDQDDRYTDNRQDYIKNEVACDYNAGFQSAVAGLLQLSQEGNC